MTAIYTKSKSVLISSDDFLYDDCPVCRAMKKAQKRGYDLSEEELQEAFAQANKQSSSKSN